jgi:WD40 repeat protein
MRTVLSLLALLLPADTPTPIEVSVPKRAEPVSFANDVADILAAKCLGCHSSSLAESKLNLEEVAGMLKGGKRGPAIVPGKADESLLFKMASHRAEPVMPPKDKKEAKPLTPEELGLLKLWIDAGAKDDSAEVQAKPIELGTLPPGVHPVVAVDMTADGKRIAAGRANVVQVYDADSGLEIISLGGHKDIIQSLRFSPDGKRLAAGSYQIVTVWNLPPGGVQTTFKGHNDQVKAVAVAPDGSSFVSAGADNALRFWDPSKESETARLDLPAQALSVANAPDGKSLAWGGSDNLVHVVGLPDRKEILTLKGHGGPVEGVAFLADGKHLVSVSADGTARVWTLPDDPSKPPAEPVVLSGHKGPIHAVAVTRDGKGIITGGEDATARLWSLDDRKEIWSFAGHGGPVLAVAVSPDGSTLLTGSADKTARTFDLATGAPGKTLAGHPGPIQAVAFSPQGDRLVTAGAEGGIKVWEADSGRGVIAFGHTPIAPGNPPPSVQGVAFLGSGRIVSASADKTLKTWTFEGSWTEGRTLGPHVFRVLSLDFSPDGSLLATGGGEPSRSGEVKVWELNKGFLVRSFDGLHSDTVFGVRFSPDGQKLATGAADKFLKVVALIGGAELRSYEGHTHHVLAVDWRSDGKQLVSGGADNVLKVWDFDTGDQLRTLQAAGKQVTAVRWLPKKPTVAGASGDKLVRFWNADNTGIERNFGGPEDYVFGVAVAEGPDGLRVAAGGADGAVFLWKGDDTQVLRKLGPAEK